MDQEERMARPPTAHPITGTVAPGLAAMWRRGKKEKGPDFFQRNEEVEREGMYQGK